MSFLTAILPSYLKDSLLCFTVVNSTVADGVPDIATCNSNGYMYEIKNKKVIRCLNLGDKVICIKCSYVIQNEALRLYYLALTESRKLLIIRRSTVSLQVIRTYDEVKEFKVYDFEGLGFPQIKINFVNGVDDLICTFPSEEPATVKADENKIKIDEDNDEPNPLVDSLEEKLQIIKKHIDELTEEYNLLRKQFSSKETPEEFGMISLGPLKFTSPLKNVAQPVVKICDKWLKVIGSHLVIGIKIHNCGSEIVQDVELFLNHEEITDYVYRIFRPNGGDLHSELFSVPSDHRCVKPAEEVWVVGGFRVPAFRSGPTLSVPYCLTSSDLGEWLLRDEFEVSVLDIASWSNGGMEEGITVAGLMAIRTIKSETRLQLRTGDLGKDTPGSLLVTKLGFRQIRHHEDELFCCTSGYLNEVLVALQHLAENPSVWEMLLFTGEQSQVYFLVNALYELLPENTVISCRGEKNDNGLEVAPPTFGSSRVNQSERQLNWSL